MDTMFLLLCFFLQKWHPTFSIILSLLFPGSGRFWYAKCTCKSTTLSHKKKLEYNIFKLDIDWKWIDFVLHVWKNEIESWLMHADSFLRQILLQKISGQILKKIIVEPPIFLSCQKILISGRVVVNSCGHNTRTGAHIW